MLENKRVLPRVGVKSVFCFLVAMWLVDVSLEQLGTVCRTQCSRIDVWADFVKGLVPRGGGAICTRPVSLNLCATRQQPGKRRFSSTTHDLLLSMLQLMAGSGVINLPHTGTCSEAIP